MVLAYVHKRAQDCEVEESQQLYCGPNIMKIYYIIKKN